MRRVNGDELIWEWEKIESLMEHFSYCERREHPVLGDNPEKVRDSQNYTLDEAKYKPVCIAWIHNPIQRIDEYTVPTPLGLILSFIHCTDIVGPNEVL